MTVKNGFYLEFKSQKEINRTRRAMTDNAYKKLKERTHKMIEDNRKLITNIKAH